VLSKLADWLDHRTGYRKLIDALLLEHIPGGAKWRYVWGSTLVFVFAVQLITGVLLMTAYSPGDSTAWASVYFIQYEMDFGWLIRGLHHFGSQTMVVLLALHMLQVVIAGAHLPPREINWWLGLGLLGAVLGLSLTGYLLPWDQKGYWATKVATNIAGNLPGVGAWLAKVIVGGPEYGHHTLTRFYALHVGILPPLVVVLIIAHLALFRRHGVTHPKNAPGEGWFWPDQAFRDMLVSMVIFAVMLGLVIYGHGHALETQEGATSMYDRIAHAGRAGVGANLDAPAEPGSESYPARPEWYFLFLFQVLKYFEGPLEVVGTIVIPNGAIVLLFLLPLLGYGGMRKFGHAFGVVVVVSLFAGVGLLTVLALREDAGSETLQAQFAEAAVHGKRSIELARDGVPADGAVNLLRRDPLTQGPKLFAQHCGSCHEHQAIKIEGPSPKYVASDLTDFGTEKWIRDLLQNPADPRFLGRTNLKEMDKWVKKQTKDNKPEERKELEEEFDVIAKWLAGHPRTTPTEEDEKSTDPRKAEYVKGFKAFEGRCIECHTFDRGGGGNLTGPDFTGYGGEEWLRMMIMAPNHPLRYGWRNRNAMPIFRDLTGPGSELTGIELERQKEALLKDAGDDDKKKEAIENSCRVLHLTDVERELILRWLLEDYRVVFGGEPISGAARRDK
jgi:ubiquinol-cytochrome c reductase cytochrome b subunit